jgi:hypothetical protein
MTVSKHGEQAGGYLPISKDGHALLIEDEEVANKVHRKMIEAGVNIVEAHVD